MVLLEAPSTASDRPSTVPQPPDMPPLNKGTTFRDARLGKWQLSAMGLQAFGGFKDYKKWRPAEAQADAPAESLPELPTPPATAQSEPLRDGQRVKAPPSAVPGRLPLSARPWESAQVPAAALAAAVERLPWDSPRVPTSRAQTPRAQTPRAPMDASPRGGRATVPPLEYTRPSTRGDAVGLGERLQRSLEKAKGEGRRHEMQDREWHNVFLELVRQVYVHCNERGQLLDTVRVHLESQLSEARNRLAEQGRELQALKRETSMLLGAPPTSGGTNNKRRDTVTQKQEDAKRAAMELQRVDALVTSASSMATDKQGILMTKLIKQLEANEVQPLLKEVLNSTSEGELLTLLVDQILSLRVTAFMNVLEKVLDPKVLQQGNRQMLITMLVEQLEETERARQAIDIVKQLPAQQVGDVAKHLLQGMSKLARQPTVNSLIKGLSKDERISMTSDVLGTVPLGDMLQIVHARSTAMDSTNRGALMTTVLETMPREEKNQLVTEQLVAMANDDRAEMLGSIFGLMTAGQRQEIADKLSRTRVDIED